jgi:TetR/AcrR family transcriptional regulator, regulator of biofilm formation and stress response
VAHVPTDVRRQQFIDAAVNVIARVGVDGATTRRIAEEAGAPLATLHYCFQTKENLLWAVFEQLVEVTRADLEEKSEVRGEPIATMASMLLGDTVQWAIDNPSINRTQIEIWLWAERNDTEFAIRLYGMFIDAWKGFLRGASDPLSEDQLETVTRVVVSLIDGLSMQFITHGDEKMILREAETAQAMLRAFLESGVRQP